MDIFLVFLLIIAPMVDAVLKWLTENWHLWTPVLLAAVHVFEQHANGFTPFFNRRVLRSRFEYHPISAREAFWKDELGLFALLAYLFLSGDPFLYWIGFGLIAADAAQHVVYSIGFRGYTPGFTTSVYYATYLGFAGYHLRADFIPLGLGIGIAAVAGNLIVAAVRVENKERKE